MIYKLLLGLFLLVLFYVIWQAQELKKFNLTRYEISSEKLQDKHTWVVLSDVHLWQYGAHNERLLSAIEKEHPEAIFLPGDLVIHTKPEKFYIAEELMEQLIKIAPVYFSNGNHESRLEDPAMDHDASYQKLKHRMEELGVHVLNNDREVLVSGKDRIMISGLELPLKYYKKGVDTPMESEELMNCLGEADADNYQILLAHTPKYVPEYFRWGADLSLSGHYHGGLVCVPGIGSIISPQFELFPKYSFGRFDEGSQRALVSRGLGTHTFHIRIFDRSELLVISASPGQNQT